MQIRILRDCSAGSLSFKAGKSYRIPKDIPKDIAEKLLAIAGTAEAVKNPKG